MRKYRVHKVYVEIATNCIIDKALFPLLRLPLVSKHNVVIPSTCLHAPLAYLRLIPSSLGLNNNGFE